MCQAYYVYYLQFCFALCEFTEDLGLVHGEESDMTQYPISFGLHSTQYSCGNDIKDLKKTN